MRAGATVAGGKDTPAAPAPPERITVALIPKAGDDLQLLHDRTTLSKTDLVNRAIISHAFIDAQQRAGRDLIVRDNGTGETKLVRFV